MINEINIIMNLTMLFTTIILGELVWFITNPEECIDVNILIGILIVIIFIAFEIAHLIVRKILWLPW